jgi:hypothetical protein
LVSVNERITLNNNIFKYHSLEDIVGMVNKNIVTFGEGAEIIGDLLVVRFFDYVEPLSLYQHYFNLMETSKNHEDYFQRMFVFGKSLEKLI